MSIAADLVSQKFSGVRSRNVSAMVHTFFFISGIPALIYQLVWQHALFRIFGVSLDSVTVVVTAFMLGLGIGSLFGSWLSRRHKTEPLLTVAVFELMIGAFGACSLPFFNWVDPIVQDLSLYVRALVVIGLVFLPTVLMGATLPVLVGYAVRRSVNVGFSVGTLYRVNALGAVCGCALSALLLFPFLGLQAATIVGAILNLLVAAIAVLARLCEREQSSTTLIAPLHNSSPGFYAGLGFRQALLLVFASGFVSLSFEIFLLRLASFASGTNSLVFSLTLGAFLLGIASGAKVASDWCKHNAADAPLPTGLTILLMVHGIVGLALLPVLALSGALGRGLLAIIALAAFFVARSLAGVFLLVAHRAVAPDRNAGSQSGLLYLANICGSAAGSMITGFMLSDVLGATALATVLSLSGLSATCWFVWQWSSHRRLPGAVLITMTSAALLIVFEQPLSASAINVMLFKKDARHLSRLTSVVENRDGIIAVDREGVVYGGGVYDGRFNVDLVHDSNGIIRAYALSLFHPRPREVLMIGLASGSWAQVIANDPDVRHLTVVEINPGYIVLVRARPEVKSLLNNAKVSIVVDDAHRWLKRHPDKKFDAIMANATYNYRSNASNLLSTEFNRLVGSHLKDGGVYFFNSTDSIRVQKTGCASFPFGFRVFNHMLVSNAAIHFDGTHWRKVLLAWTIDGRRVVDPSRTEGRELLAKLMMLPRFATTKGGSSVMLPIEPCGSILARAGGAVPITDDNMGTEWRYPLGLE